MRPRKLAFAAVVAVVLAGCCEVDPPEEKRIQGTYHRIHVTSDFNDTIEILYWDRDTTRNNNLIDLLLNCSSYDERFVTRSMQVNAFNGFDLTTFVEDENFIGITVNYHNQSANYIAAGGNVLVRLSDF